MSIGDLVPNFSADCQDDRYFVDVDVRLQRYAKFKIRQRLASETEIQHPLKKQCFDCESLVVSAAADSALERVRLVDEFSPAPRRQILLRVTTAHTELLSDVFLCSYHQTIWYQTSKSLFPCTC